MTDRAAIMIPDGKEHREMLIEENGYREGHLLDATQTNTDRLTLVIQDKESGDTVRVTGASVSSLYGANKRQLHPDVREELDEVYTPGSTDALDLEKVANMMFVGPDRVSGLRFVYHESAVNN